MAAAIRVHSSSRSVPGMIPDAAPLPFPGTNRVKSHPDFDAYILKAAPFARPILKKVRALFHQACPGIEETMKWSFPHFEYRGIVGSMAAFKQHATFGFWKASLMNDPCGLLSADGDTAMGRATFTDVSELPPDNVLLEYIREAVALNEQGVKVAKPKRQKKPEAEVPADLWAALKKNKKALAAFEAFSPSHRREYVEWITEAKQEATRNKRVAQAVEWIAGGKSRNWKYQRK
jgi:uncharacterized protein YdeI (YjbR/CyaY-like superfamily)